MKSARIVRVALALVLLALALAPARALAAHGNARLLALVDELADARWRQAIATRFGPQAQRAWRKRLKRFDSRLGRYDVHKLSEADRRLHRYARELVTVELAAQAREVALSDVSALQGRLLTITGGVDAEWRDSVTSWRRVIARLRASTRFAKQYVGLLEAGMASGYFASRDAINSALEFCQQHGKLAASNPLMKLEAELAKALAGRPQLPELKRELRAALRDHAIPAHQRIARFLAHDVLPRAPKVASHAEARYAHYLRVHLGPGYDAEQLIKLGEREVRRARAQLTALMGKLDPKATSLAQFLRRAHGKKDGYANKDELFADARRQLARARTLAAKVIDLPDDEVRIKPVPKAEERLIEAQYLYQGDNKGELQLNTGPLLKDQRRWNMATLMTHELYPGHHGQSLAMDRHEVPPVLQDASTALIEGWAMYTEHLRNERGGFSPYEKLGHLMFRLRIAEMLVVDPSLHLGKMTKQQAAHYLHRNEGMPLTAARARVQRCIDSPGQSVAYAVGKYQLLETRATVRRVLGKHFEQRAFHDKLLSLGSLPPMQVHRAMRSWARRKVAAHRRVARSRTR